MTASTRTAWTRLVQIVKAVVESLIAGATMSQKIEQVLTAVAELKQDVDTLTEAVANESAQVAALKTKIEELQAQVAAGNAATPEQLDALLVDIQSIQQNLQAATTAVANLAPDAA